MRFCKTIIGIIISVFILPTLYAAPDILPGLWENKIEMSSKSGKIEQAMAQAQQMLASMPPEQRKMMEDMMAKQGVNMDFANRIVQTCITQERINKFDLSETEEGCEQTFEEKNKNHYSLTLECPQKNMSGRGDFVINNNKSYASTIVLDVNMNGQADTMTLKQQGTWLATDCGNITPK